MECEQGGEHSFEVDVGLKTEGDVDVLEESGKLVLEGTQKQCVHFGDLSAVR